MTQQDQIYKEIEQISIELQLAYEMLPRYICYVKSCKPMKEDSSYRDAYKWAIRMARKYSQVIRENTNKHDRMVKYLNFVKKGAA